LLCLMIALSAYLQGRVTGFSDCNIVRKIAPLPIVLKPLQAVEVIDPNFNLAVGSLLFGFQFNGLEPILFRGNDAAKFIGNVVRSLKFFFVIFGLFLVYQTTTLRFEFDDSNNFALVKSDGGSSGKNVVVGGENSWNVRNIVNYRFIPGERLPILIYFKETETTNNRVDGKMN